MAGAAFGVSLFVAGAAFGEVHVSLFVAGAVFGEVQVSLFVAGAVFGEVEVSLFVAGAVFGEIWNDSRSAKCCNFSIEFASGERESNLGRRGGFSFAFSWSDHSRIILGTVSDHARIGRALEMTFHLFSPNFLRFWKVIFRGRRSIW